MKQEESKIQNTTPKEVMKDCHRLYETFIMTYTYAKNAWKKSQDSNLLRLMYEKKTNKYFLLIIPLVKENVMVRAYLTSKCDYKKYSRYFYRFKSEQGKVFGFLFLTTVVSKDADTLYDYVTEIIKNGKLSDIKLMRTTEAKPNQQNKTLTGVPNESSHKTWYSSLFRTKKKGRNHTINSSFRSSHVKTESSREKSGLILTRKTPYHVEFDQSTQKLVGLPPEWESSILNSFFLPYKCLKTVKTSKYKSEIPEILLKLKENIIRFEGLTKEGIFRVSTSYKDLAPVVRQYNSSNFDECTNPLLLAQIFKKFYRELPVPIIKDNQLSNFMDKERLIRIKDQKVEDIMKKENAHLGNQDFSFAKEIFGGIPEPLKSLFEFLLDFFIEISKNKDANRMNEENLAIVMSPNLFRIKKTLGSAEIIMLTTEMKKFMKNCIILRREGAI